jgi:hypothetical protein
VRRCNLLYYLVDDSIQLVEPRTENSGLLQGKLLKRHRVAKRDEGGGFVAWADLTVGSDLLLYGRAIHLSGCDGFTRVRGGVVNNFYFYFYFFILFKLFYFTFIWRCREYWPTPLAN